MPLVPLFILVLLTTAAAETGSLRHQALQSIDATVRLGIHEQHFPGGVLWFQHGDQVYHRAYGNRWVDPVITANTKDTLYDAASLTKVVATTPAVMLLVERGQLDLESPVVRYVPEFTGQGKEHILLRQVLTHTSGLRPGIPRNPEWSGYAEGLKRIWDQVPIYKPDEKFVYSDINFILLGELVYRVSGQPLDRFCQRHIFGPLQMHDTGFRPPEVIWDRVAPTTREGAHVVHGVVHDPTSRRMGGVTGHAGLFTTATDVARFGQMLLGEGELDGVRIFTPETVAQMTRPNQPPSITATRGLGWDLDSPHAHPRGEHFGETSYGHTGWTGTSIWIDPPSQSFIIFLTNRNHPSEAGRTKQTRIRLASLAAEATGVPTYQISLPRRTLNGVDVLAARRFRDLKGLRVGLITNHTGVTRSGQTTIDLLHQAPDVDLKALFGPEHGIRGSEDTSHIADGKDEKTGLPIYSLYGETRRPQAEHLTDLDALVFDIQDIGCRFYTYISTMHRAMEEAAGRKLKFFVLDRINPINGRDIDGPVLDGPTSFTATHPIPLRHGMTAGELACMIQSEQNLDLDLHVIPLSGWRRHLYQDQTDLPWVNPSPNMRSLTEAILYPGIGLLEFMNLSVGRGTETPFELIGAPYLDAEALKEHLQTYTLPGIRFETITFTPEISVFKDTECRGIRFTLTDRERYRSVDTGLAIAIYLAEHHAEEAKFENFHRLLKHPRTFDLVKAGASLAEIRASWSEALADFKKRRQSCLLY